MRTHISHIIPEENNFDPATEHMVLTHINNNREQFSPLTRANNNNLDPNNPAMKEITTQEVQHVIKKLKNNTPGRSNINKTVLLNSPSELIQKLTTFLNNSLSMGFFPGTFKHAKIKLIPKANKTTTDPNNYRPTSLLEVPGKLFEKILNNRPEILRKQQQTPPSSTWFQKQPLYRYRLSHTFRNNI